MRSNRLFIAVLLVFSLLILGGVLTYLDISVFSLPGKSVTLTESGSFFPRNNIIVAKTIAAFLVGLIALSFFFFFVFVQRKQDQAREENLLRQLKSIFRHLPVGIAYLNTKYEFIGANRFFCDFTGFREEELIGRTCYEMIGEYAGDTTKAGVEKICSFCGREECLTEKRPSVFFRTLGKAYFKVTIIPELNEAGNVYRIMEVFEDITDRKLTEKALRESEKNFRELVESSLIGILISQDKRVIYKNPELERLLGHLPRTFDLADFVGIHPDDIEKVKHVHQSIRDGESRDLDVDFRFYPPDKMFSKPDMKWVYCRTSLIEYQGQDATIFSMMDMTRAKELEHLLRMEDKMTSLGHVAAGIAHEIRNPLSGINIYLSSLEKISRREGSEEMVKSIISQLRSASNKIESVIRRVMNFSRPCEPRFVLTNINKPIETALELCAVTLRKADTTIVMDLAEDLPACYIDPSLMEQVILNLITNASEAMRDVNSQKIIQIVSRMEPERIVVRVADSGPGVPANLKDKIFEPFYTTKYDGTGIGLSLCHRIITDHGGSFDIATSKYGGAEFVIQVPLERRGEKR